METYIAYFDETGDDGSTCKSSDSFVLTSLYMNSNDWQSNYNKMKSCRFSLKEKYGFHVAEEMHTKCFLTGKDPYGKYQWSIEQKREILKEFALCIASMKLKVINVIIDKRRISNSSYKVLENALTYNIQRIENDSNGNWNYIIITDKGRLAPMRKTARAIRSFNPIQSKYSLQYMNQPINYLLEDILEKDSSESYFIQICDFISYFVHLYFHIKYRKEQLPNRVGTVIDKSFVLNTMEKLKESEILNLKASSNNSYGLVIYPR